jgi:hypothetical protein
MLEGNLGVTQKRDEEKSCVSKWQKEENLQIQDLFLRASRRTGPNDK